MLRLSFCPLSIFIGDTALVTQTPHHSHEQSFNNDEIDLLALFKSMLRTWKFWLLSLIVVSAAYGCIKAVTILAVTPESVYSKPIRLTFPNAHKLEFPSGAKFAYSDIVAPAVVQMAFEKNKLENYGLTISDLQNGLSAIPYAPTYPLIVKRYERLMSDKKLTADMIANLQQQLEKEVEQATSGRAVIRLRLEQKSIPKDVAVQVLNDIPAIWAGRAMKEKGVLQINVQLASSNALNMDFILNEDILIARDLLTEKLAALQANIRRLTEFEGAQSVTDPNTGMRLVDLSVAADDLNDYVIGKLLAPVRLQGISEKPDLSRYYYEDKINKLTIELNSLTRRADAIKTVSNSYSDFSKTNEEPRTTGEPFPNVVPQLNGDVLDKLVSMSGEIEREKYKQKLNDDWLEITQDIAKTESAIADAQQILTALKKTTSASLNAEQQKLLSIARQFLPQILEKISSFFGVSNRIYQQLSIESVGIRDQLYIPMIDGVLENKVIIDIKSTILTWIALMFLTSVLVIPGRMIYNAMKERDAQA
jgi:hypothetical protein